MSLKLLSHFLQSASHDDVVALHFYKYVLCILHISLHMITASVLQSNLQVVERGLESQHFIVLEDLSKLPMQGRSTHFIVGHVGPKSSISTASAHA